MTLESTKLHADHFRTNSRHPRSEEAFAPEEMSKGHGEMMPLFKFGDKLYIAMVANMNLIVSVSHRFLQYELDELDCFTFGSKLGVVFYHG